MTQTGHTGRLFVVVREVEGLRVEYAIFADLSEATQCYDEAVYVVRNAPGEGASDDLTIVTASALYAADTTDPELATAMAADGSVILLESEEWDNRTTSEPPPEGADESSRITALRRHRAKDRG
jgi:hypothetical protein